MGVVLISLSLFLSTYCHLYLAGGNKLPLMRKIVVNHCVWHSLTTVKGHSVFLNLTSFSSTLTYRQKTKWSFDVLWLISWRRKWILQQQQFLERNQKMCSNVVKLSKRDWCNILFLYIKETSEILSNFRSLFLLFY